MHTFTQFAYNLPLNCWRKKTVCVFEHYNLVAFMQSDIQVVYSDLKNSIVHVDSFKDYPESAVDGTRHSQFAFPMGNYLSKCLQ